jgi:site-specific DNA recombinase
MTNVTVIPAAAKPWKQPEVQVKKLRVAAYCRVSTEFEEQESSYTTQVNHYTDYINNHPEWLLAGIYADDGISATNTKKREQFNKMIDDCMAGKIDMVITKSISRFARNTLDCLKYIRQLKEVNIPVFFEKENINTMDAKGEVLITIMASLAQQESQSLSQNVKLGIQYRNQQGIVRVNSLLGYKKDANKKLIVDPERAWIVKRIFQEFLDGYAPSEIARRLEADGVITDYGKKQWRSSSIELTLHNEKYMGDALLGKTYTVDFLTKKRVVNTGQSPQYYVEDDHEAIIPKEEFLAVQAEMDRRKTIAIAPDGTRRSYTGKTCFSQRVFCGVCGDMYAHIFWYDGGKHTVWRCASRMDGLQRFKKDHCTGRTVTQEDLERISAEAIRQEFGGDSEKIKEIAPDLQCNLENGFDEMLVRRLIRKITVCKDTFIVEFKSGNKRELS